MTQTDIETWELNIPDNIVICWVFTESPNLCVDHIAAWIVDVGNIMEEYSICNGCKNRWHSYGTIISARPL